MIEHETKREFVQRINRIGKFLYIIGTLKLQEKQGTFRGKYCYGHLFRVIHPVSWVLALFLFITHGINKETIQEIKKHSTLI